jgi:hypothetical protein
LSRRAIEPAELPGGENLRGGKRLRLRFWEGCHLQHAYPFALNRPLIASFQLRSHVVWFPLGVRPLSLDSPVLSLGLGPLPPVLISLVAASGKSPPSLSVSWLSGKGDPLGHSQGLGVEKAPLPLVLILSEPSSFPSPPSYADPRTSPHHRSSLGLSMA